MGVQVGLGGRNWDGEEREFRAGFTVELSTGSSNCHPTPGRDHPFWAIQPKTPRQRQNPPYCSTQTSAGQAARLSSSEERVALAGDEISGMGG